jgi:hypothetical protein
VPTAGLRSVPSMESREGPIRRKRGTHMAPEPGREVAHVKLDISGKVVASCSLTARRSDPC